MTLKLNKVHQPNTEEAMKYTLELEYLHNIMILALHEWKEARSGNIDWNRLANAENNLIKTYNKVKESK